MNTICGMGLTFRLDGFRLIYCCIAVFMWSVSGIFSREYMAHYEKKRRYYLFFWATFAATVGVFLSADLFTTFLFFEIMSFTSYVWVAFDERKESLRAAETYLSVAVIGGMVMLMGLFLLYDLFGTLVIEELGPLAELVLAGQWAKGAFDSPAAQLYTAGGLILFGFGAKAGCFPLHIWLPKAHPEAPAPASALLSGILTKAGVFGIVIVSTRLFTRQEDWGILIAVLGLATMTLGAVLAVFSVNLKKILACSSISQIGFIMTGIGMACLLASQGENNSLAVRGAFLHMMNHSLLKLVLFLCAGVVYMNLHQLDLNDVRGFGRNKPVLKFAYLMGAFGIGGIPFWNGYISKTLIHEGIVEYIEVLGGPILWKGAEWLFLFAGGMTIAYMLKIFVALFVEEHPDRQAEFDALASSYMRPSSKIALLTAAAVLPVLGMMPYLTMDRLADLGQGFFYGSGHAHAVSYFSLTNLKGAFISVTIGVLLYVLVIRNVLMVQEKDGVRRYADRWPGWLDLENLIYRPVLQKLLPDICGAVLGFIDKYLISVLVTVFLAVASVVCRGMDHLADGFIRLVRMTTHRQAVSAEELPEHRLTARLARKERMLKRTGGLVEESFSFGLLLVCIGLCLTLVYLLYPLF